MMISFREKWFPAWLLAIILHVVVIFILYLNVNSNRSDHHADSDIEIAAQSLTPNPVNNDSSLKSKAYTTSITSTKEATNLKSDAESKSSETVQVADTISNNSVQNTMSIQASSASSTSELKQPLAQTTQEKRQLADNRESKMLKSSATENDEDFERVKNEVGLLDMDIPTKNSELKINKEYLVAKSEIDAVNDQLSAAINEVKNRNQQKIEQTQKNRQPSYIGSIDSVTRNNNEVE